MATRNTIEVRVPFTRAEQEDLANDMVTAVMAIKDLKDEKKEVDARLNAKIKDHEADLERVAKLHHDGDRPISIVCELRLNHEEQKREWIATEGATGFAAGDIVKTEPFQPNDNQKTIFDEDASGEPEDGGEEADESEDEAPEEEEGDTELDEGLRETVNEAWGAAAEEAAAMVEENESAAEGEPEASDEASDDAGSNLFDEESDDFDEEDVEEVGDQGLDVDGTKPPPFTITPNHATVLRAIRDYEGTDLITFANSERSIRAAANHLIAMGYVEAEEGDSDDDVLESIIGLTRKGADLFEAGFVPD